MKQPRKVSKAERVARALRQRVAYDRSKPDTTARESHLRALMGLPEPLPLTTPAAWRGKPQPTAAECLEAARRHREAMVTAGRITPQQAEAAMRARAIELGLLDAASEAAS